MHVNLLINIYMLFYIYIYIYRVESVTPHVLDSATEVTPYDGDAMEIIQNSTNVGRANGDPVMVT